MTQTMFNLTKHIANKNLLSIQSDIRARQSNMRAKQVVLEKKHKLPMQAQIDVIESQYKLDYFVYSSLCYIYAVIKHAKEDEVERILNGYYKLEYIHLAIYEELFGTSRYEKVMDEYKELIEIPEVEKFMEYFGGYER